MKLFVTILFFLGFFLFSCQQSISDPESPDGRITVKTGTLAGMPFSYSVFKEGEVMVGASAIGLEFRDQPGADFLKLIQTSWDETKYLGGYPGEDIIMARRKGNDWYVAGMSGEESRTAEFIADFTGSDTWDVTLWKDGPESFETPAFLVKESMLLSSGDSVSIRMERGGGFVMILNSPVPAGS